MLHSEYSIIELHRLIKETISKYTEIANSHFNTTFKKCSYSFSPRMKTTGGTCSDNHHIVLSSPILRLNHVEDFMDQVLVHEIAHSIALQYYNTFAHDKYFYYVLNTVFKSPYKKCHTLKVDAKRYTYHCNCDNKVIQVNPRVHNKIQNGIKYKCTICNSELF